MISFSLKIHPNNIYTHIIKRVLSLNPKINQYLIIKNNLTIKIHQIKCNSKSSTRLNILMLSKFFVNLEYSLKDISYSTKQTTVTDIKITLLESDHLVKYINAIFIKINKLSSNVFYLIHLNHRTSYSISNNTFYVILCQLYKLDPKS
jgi:hypothetical protein